MGMQKSLRLWRLDRMKILDSAGVSHATDQRQNKASKPSNKSKDWVLHVPLWVQMTFFIAVTAIISLFILAVITVVKTTDYGKTIMSSRLSSYASLQAAIVEQTIQSLQSDVTWMLNRPAVASTMADRQQGNFSHSAYNEMGSYLTSMIAVKGFYEAVVIYDAGFNLTYSRAQAAAGAPLASLLPAMSVLLPLENLPIVDMNRLNNLGGILLMPVPLYQNGQILSYALSITVPIVNTNNGNSTALYANSTNPVIPGSAQSIVGYGTVVFSSIGAGISLNGSGAMQPQSFLNYGMATTFDSIQGFELLFDTVDPKGQGSSDLEYPFSAYPAMLAADSLPANYSSSNRPRGAIMNTHTLNETSASVGYSVIDIMGRRWLLCVEVSRNAAYSDIWQLRNRLIGVCLGILGLVLLLVIPVGRLMTNPLYKIYYGMNFEPRESQEEGDEPQPTKNAVIAFFDRYLAMYKPQRPQPRRRATTEPATEDSNQDLQPFQARKMPWYKRVASLQFLPGGAVAPRDGADHDNDSLTASLAIDWSQGFHVPAKLPTLGRWYRDELDDLVDEYNTMIDKLNNQYMFLEDQVQSRTKEAEEARVLAEKANNAKSQFIANITHELRTPLNGIMGMTSVTLSESNVQKIRVSLQVIIESGRVLMELLNELLAFSKSQIDMKPKISEFSAPELMDNLNGLFKARAEAKNLDLTFGCEPVDLRDIKFSGDYQRVVQIVGHILSNAVKFSDQNGSVGAFVRFRAHSDTNVSLGPYLRSGRRNGPPPLNMLEVVITDTGMGFSEHQMSRVFEPFVQGDDAFNKKHQGTGLGMSMCKQLAEVIGGYVAVWSRQNAGACVIFRCPIRIVDAPTNLAMLESPPLQWTDEDLFFTSSVNAGKVEVFSNNKAKLSPSPVVKQKSENTPVSTPPLVTPPQTSARHQKSKSFMGSFLGIGRRPSQSSKTNDILSQRNSSRTTLSTSSSRPAHRSSIRNESLSLHADKAAHSENASENSAPPHARKTGLVRQGKPAPLNMPTQSKSAGSSALIPMIVPHLANSPMTATFNIDDNEVEQKRKQFLAVQHPNIKVIVADDNNLNLQIMVRMLKTCGVTQVDTAGDGETVVKLVEKSIKNGVHYTVIFMDLVMPRLNGLDAAHIIRTTLGYPYPIVALTGYSDQQTTDMCLATSIQEVLVKPVLRNAVVDILLTYETPVPVSG